MAKPLVVYVLGAGFSRPLGLPLVFDFIRTARDLYRVTPESLPHFEKVFERLDSLAPIKNHLEANHLNIEEVLSTMEMEDALRGTARSDDVRRFIADVVLRTTPPLPERRTSTQTRIANLYEHTAWLQYLWFLEGIFGARSLLTPDEHVVYDAFGFTSASYGIVSLNYDCVLESALKIMGQHAICASPTFARSIKEHEDDANRPCLAKLHGCASQWTSIVPMTWNKTIRPEIEAEWKLAFELLRCASEIRFIGYSLPSGDAYVRFLLKAALRTNRSLRQIDVLTIDGDGETLTRYAKLISLPFTRRFDLDSKTYLEYTQNASRPPPDLGRANPRQLRVADRLEEAHSRQMTELELLARSNRVSAALMG